MGINSNNPPEIQTDKAKTKVVPCAVEDCGQPLVVNTFYAPARARCSRHRDAPINIGVEAVRSAEVAHSAGVPTQVIANLPVAPTPNHSLEKLCCPFGHGFMTIIRVDPKMGFLTFKCGECKTAVEVKPAWAPLLMRTIPDALKPLVAAFNQEMLDRGASYVSSGQYLQSAFVNAGRDMDAVNQEN